MGVDVYAYQNSTDPNAMLNTFLHGNIEQQGQIFQDYVTALLRGANVAKFQKIAAMLKQNCSCKK